MTWKDLKLATLQKMFSADGSEIPNDESVTDYIAGMPFVANEAMQMIATFGKFFVKSLVIEKDNTNLQKYDMKELAEDFFEIDKVFYQNGTVYREYKGFSMEKSKLILVSKGTYTIYYRALPPMLNENTPDDFEIPFTSDICVILPLYMASQLYKDDDNGLATSYRNEFEIAFERLQEPDDDGNGQFTSESGWI